MDQNVRPETLNLVGKNRETLQHMGTDNNVLDWTLRMWEAKVITKGDYIKLKSFCTVSNRMKIQPMEWDKIFVIYSPGKEVIFRNIRNSKKLTKR